MSKITYYLYKYFLPISLILSASASALQKYNKTETVDGFLLLFIAVILLIFSKPFIQLRFAHVTEEGILYGVNILKWHDIDKIEPYLLNKMFLKIKYKTENTQNEIMIHTPLKFKDLFRLSSGTEFSDNIFNIWKKKLAEQNFSKLE